MSSTIEFEAPALTFAAEYGGALADHLPMTLSALKRMGATAERRATFARQYISAKRLRILDASDDERLARVRMQERIAAKGRASVLREELPGLARGVGAGAFHALIRVAYGIMDERDDEIAAGLTYWHRAALDLGALEDATGGTEPFDAPVALARAGARLRHLPHALGLTGLIAQRMSIIANDGDFDEAVGLPRLNVESIPAIAAMTVRAFAATRSFTLLHAMTATHALRLVVPFAPDPIEFLGFFWRAYVAAYISAVASPLPDDATLASECARVPAWDTLMTRACASDDEHVVKATFTAWTEDAIYGDPMYRVAAARYMQRE